MISYHTEEIMVDERFTIHNGELAACASDLGIAPGITCSTISLKSPKTGDVVIFTVAGCGYGGQIVNYAGKTKTGKIVKLEIIDD